MQPLLAIIVLAQVGGAGGLAETLRAVEEGAEVQVPRGVAAEAARALATASVMSTEQVDLHLRVAVRGGAHEELAAVTPALLADDGAALEPCLRALGGMGPRERAAVLRRVPASARTRPRVREACLHEDDLVARGAVAVAAPACAPDDAADLLRRVSADAETRGAWAAEALAAAPPSRELLDALVRVEPELPVAVAAALGPSLAALVDRDQALVGPLLDALASQPSVALLGGLAAIPPDRDEAALAVVMDLVTGLSADAALLTGPEVALLVAAIQAGAELRAPALLFELPALCRPDMPIPVRAAALRALGELGAREAATVDLLLGHLAEPAPLGPAAYEALVRRSGARMPHRPAVWQEWREATALAEMTPEEHAARLRAERAQRHDARRLAVRRAARD